MRTCLLFILFLQVCNHLSAQVYTAEVMPGNRYLFYQHLFHQKFKENGKTGIVHIANISNWYEHDPGKGGMSNEIMNQAYISMQAGRSITFMGGIFYTNVTGIRPAIAVQFAHRFKNGLLVLVPRADVINSGSVELMGMIEYEPQLTKKTKLYSRLQFMTNTGPYHHNRSYQRARIGINVKKFQVGVGVNVNEYGYPGKLKINTGIFLRRLF